MHKKMECPICKKKVLFVGVHDDEGNFHGLVGCEYENDPWSGLSYALHHEGWGDCPLCTDGAYSTMGGMLFDTAEDAISALSTPNEPLTLDKKRVIAESCLHYSKSGRCGLNGYAPLDFPKCKEWQNNEPNEPLTLEQLREINVEPMKSGINWNGLTVGKKKTRKHIFPIKPR